MFNSRHFFFFNDTATTEIYTLSLHDALPIYEGAADRAPALHRVVGPLFRGDDQAERFGRPPVGRGHVDRKSTRLNSSHLVISYAVFCLKKKKKVINGLQI